MRARQLRPRRGRRAPEAPFCRGPQPARTRGAEVALPEIGEWRRILVADRRAHEPAAMDAREMVTRRQARDPLEPDVEAGVGRGRRGCGVRRTSRGCARERGGSARPVAHPSMLGWRERCDRQA
jgi:hypothetical protein